MMDRDLIRPALALTVSLVLVLGAGLGAGPRDEGDEPEPPETKDEYFDLHSNVMNADTKIRRVIRSVPRVERRPSAVREPAEEIVKHGKITRGTTAYATGEGDMTVEKWVEFTDGMLKHGQELVEATAEDDVDVKAAQEAYKNMSKSCETCHEVFRKQ